jgi:hypothetical protein
MFLLGLSISFTALLVLVFLLFLSPDLRRQHPLLRSSAKFLASEEVVQLAAKVKAYFSSPKFAVLDNFLGASSALRIITPLLLLISLGALVIGPMLAGPKLGLVLGLVIATTYTARIILHMYINFRSLLLAQIERVLLSIRNNLSAGMTLDYAVNETAKVTNDEPIATDLKNFLVIAETNFLESFPAWLDALRRKFHLRSLAKSAQLLGLELHYTNNQEEAFMDAVNTVNNSLRVNKKQSSTLNITLFTLDFMVLAFFAVLFYVIPAFTSTGDISWWASAERPWVIFQAGLLVWGAYLLAVVVALRRQA